MGTGYTVNADTWAPIDWDNLSAQTFRPSWDFAWHYITLYLHKPPPGRAMRLRLRFANPDGTPFGDTLSVAVILPSDFPQNADQAWITKLLPPYTPTTEEYFLLSLEGMTFMGANEGYWAYDKADGAYPQGHRLSSNDSGMSWIPHPNDDHLFYIWGSPPAPPPPPEQPLGHYFVQQINHLITPYGYMTQCFSDAPCHLTIHWTTVKPWVHRRAATLRGLRYLYAAYWCFVEFYTLEQLEPGDTVRHTFDWPIWPICETRYFRFSGTRADEPMKSDSAISHLHFPGWPIKNLLNEPWSWLGVAIPPLTLLLDEPWHWLGDTPPPFVLLLDAPWG